MAGTFVFSSGLFLGGLRGEPRRTNLGLTYMNPAPLSYRSDWWVPAQMGMVGGCIMGLAILLYFIVLVRSLAAASDAAASEVPFSLPASETYHDEDVSAVRNFTPWVAAVPVRVTGLASERRRRSTSKAQSRVKLHAARQCQFRCSQAEF
jgi:cytochrome c oxidase subunit 1